MTAFYHAKDVYANRLFSNVLRVVFERIGDGSSISKTRLGTYPLGTQLILDC